MGLLRLTHKRPRSFRHSVQEHLFLKPWAARDSPATLRRPYCQEALTTQRGLLWVLGSAAWLCPFSSYPGKASGVLS